MDARSDAAQGLAEPGAVCVPEQFVVASVGECPHHIALGIGDHIGLCAMHEVVSAESEFGEASVVGHVERNRVSPRVGDGLHLGLQRDAVVVVRDRPHHAPVPDRTGGTSATKVSTVRSVE